MKVAQIVGARPQFIKYSPISQAIDRFNSSGKVIENILIHSGQHYDYTMSDIFFNELGIKEPQYHLGVGSGSHGIQTGHILQRAEKVLLKEKPDLLYRDYKGTHNPSDADGFLYGDGKAAEKIVDIIVKYEDRLFS